MTVSGQAGDAFEVFSDSRADVLMLFGHHGFSSLSADLSFTKLVETAGVCLPSAAGDRVDGKPQLLVDGRWFVGHIDYQEPSARGLDDARVGLAFSEVYRFLRENGFRLLVTNGIHDVERGRPDRAMRMDRVRLLYKIAKAQPDLNTMFVSKSDVFELISP